jgi:hypothetical protein
LRNDIATCRVVSRRSALQLAMHGRAEMEITTEQIAALRTEAGAAGDMEMVAVCDRALAGDEAARAECGQAIDDAAAQGE